MWFIPLILIIVILIVALKLKILWWLFCIFIVLCVIWLVMWII